jgi:pimeloyl-ACP methyl ester carboxylesterase
MSRIARDSDDEVLLEYWLSHLGAADRALVRAHPDWFIAALRESQRPGQHGWARDNIVRMPTWDFDTSDIHCPVTVWYGVEDGWSLVNWLLKAVPTSTGHVLRGHGHLVPFTAPDLVLEDLVGAGKTKPA